MPFYKVTVEYIMETEKIIEAKDHYEASVAAELRSKQEFLKESSRIIKESPVWIGKVKAKEV